MPAMRRLHLLLLAVVAILAVKWTGALSVAAQNCCHPSASKADGPAAAPATRVAPTSSFGAEDVRKEFNAFSQKVRVVALLSPRCPQGQFGHAIVGGILKKFRSLKLQAILVWKRCTTEIATLLRGGRRRQFKTRASGRVGTAAGILASCLAKTLDCVKLPGTST